MNSREAASLSKACLLYTSETYNQNDFKEAGLNMVFVQDNPVSYTHLDGDGSEGIPLGNIFGIPVGQIDLGALMGQGHKRRKKKKKVKKELFKLSEIPAPVSYTHLDVYKRQALSGRKKKARRRKRSFMPPKS